MSFTFCGRVELYAWGQGEELPDFLGEDVAPNRYSPRENNSCTVEGCGADVRPAGGSGLGMCPKHYQAQRRHGHPLGALHVVREALLTSAHRYCDDPTIESLCGVARAAVAYGHQRYVSISRPGGYNADLFDLITATLRTPEAAALEVAAYAYAEHDPEAPLKSFEEAVKAFEEAALGFYRLCALDDVQDQLEVMKERRNAAARLRWSRRGVAVAA